MHGVFMNNWDELSERGFCSGNKDELDARLIAEKLKISFQRIDFVKSYWNNVFQNLVDSYQMGLAPNPDVLCNREIKFKEFFKYCKSLGADAIATGHYAQVQQESSIESPRIFRGAYELKDQSYFLSMVPSFENILFPVGHLPKNTVRQLAKDFDLHVLDSDHGSVGGVFARGVVCLATGVCLAAVG